MIAPAGVLVQGVVIGAATGLLAVGLVLTYRATRSINFAYGAMGGLPATVGVALYLSHGWPWPAAVALSVLGGALIGLLAERVARRFTRSSRLVLTVATIGMAQILGGIELLVPGWLDSPRLVGGFPTGLNDVRINIHPVVLTGNDLLILAVVPVVLAGLGWFLLRTDSGAAVRALAENEDRARLLGLPVARLSALVWVLSGALAALVVVLRAPADGLTVDAAAGATLLLPALAAAVVAGLESLPVAFAAGVGLGVVDQAVRWNVDRQATTSVVFLLVILVGLALRRRKVSRLDPDASSWSGAGRLRAVPETSRNLPEVRGARLLIIGGLTAAALLVPVLSSPSQLNQVSVALVYGLVAVSLVVLAGWGGAVSLGQVAIAGVGALVAGNLIARSNVDLFLALAAGGVAGGVIALLIGLPALRIRGLFLAVTTMAFAVAMDSFFLNPANFRELIPDSFERPVLWKRFDLSSERPLYFVCLGVLVLAVGFVAAFRRSRAGRALIATRDNDRAAEAAAVPSVRVRLEGFVVAGVIAGVAGGLHAVLLRGIGFHTYEPSLSLLAFSMAVIGGLTSVPGALSGVALVQVAGWMFPRLQLLITGTGLLVVLLVTPGGLAEAGQRLRDRLLVLVARRHGLDTTPAADGTAVLADQLPASRGTRQPVSGPAPILRCKAVDAGYGHLQVLFGADLNVQEGEMIALLGTNGAGKSTLLRAISGLLPVSGGTVEFAGASIGGQATERLASSGLALVPGGRGVFPGLTVAENLRLACWTFRHNDLEPPAAATERVLELFPRLRERLSTRAGELSGGEQQMLSLAMALAGRPRVLCIDELSLGLAPAVVEDLIGVVRDVHRSGVTVIVVEQSAATALRLADRAVFLEKGRVRFTGPTADLLDRPDLLRAVFLGAGTEAATGARPVTPNTTAGRPALECRGLTRRFGGVTAVDGVDLSVAPGEIVGILGANGAGKTTMFDLISGFLMPNAGEVILAGTDVTAAPAHRRAVAGLGRSFQEARLFPSLTVAEVVAVALERHYPNHDPVAAGLSLPASTDPEAAATARIDGLLARFGLTGYADTLTGDLSTGTRRVVELACAVAQHPVVALLDEPSAGLAQRETEALGPLLRQVREEVGCAMVVIEHDVALLAGLCDRLVALEAGAMIADGVPADVLADPAVIAAYLGSAPVEAM